MLRRPALTHRRTTKSRTRKVWQQPAVRMDNGSQCHLCYSVFKWEDLYPFFWRRVCKPCAKVLRDRASQIIRGHVSSITQDLR